ncbi:MAG TPA: glycoside hydrolase family 88 protein [Tepidisphaeraceae bacterium]|nr:glycoside hydrolase family 88 protein [Tepidisphaeraceae bacterium]
MNRCATFLSVFLSSSLFAQTSRPFYQADELKQLMHRVADFQIRAYGNTASTNWQAAPFWTGVLADYKATGDESFYQAAKKWAEATQWKLDRRTFHADDMAVGQAYLEMYMRGKQPQMIADVQSRFEQYLTRQTVTHAEVEHGPASAAFVGRNVWWWCDALFMAPPAMARMSAASGDKRYLDLMHSLYWDTTAYLFDQSEGLFFRDDSYFFDKRKSPSGKKIFWSRGNGWVYGGLIRTLDYIPKDDPKRQQYVDLFKKMTDVLVKYQGEDGMWRTSLNEATWLTTPESSGTGFFCFGMLAGVNRGYLDRKTYLPVALKAWAGLCSIVTAEGAVEYAQPVGAAPVAPVVGSFKEYSQGAFLMAASEIYTMQLSTEEVSLLNSFKPEVK